MESIELILFLGAIAIVHILATTFAEHKNIKTIPHVQELLEEVNEELLLEFRKEKSDYMQSPKGKTKKLEKLKQIGFKCEVCGIGDNLELHHTKYKNLGNEPLEDLRILCRTHHQLEHDKYGYPRTYQDYMHWDAPLIKDNECSSLMEFQSPSTQ